MKTIVIEHIHTARQALDEGAVQTARRLLDLIETSLQEPAAAVDFRSPTQMQGSILAVRSTADLIHGAICDWISDQIGAEITHSQACQWIDGSSGIEITWADKQINNSKTQVWRGYVSNSLAKLRDAGILSNEDENGCVLQKRHYRVVRKP